MSQPLYFLPDLRAAQCDTVGLRRAMLKERGLTDIFADVPMEQMPCFDVTGRGPGDKSGVILAYQTVAGTMPTRLGYYKGEQIWTPVGDGSQVWIGIDPADPPKPEDMARRRKYGGYELPLGDGNKWLIPVIRRPDDTTNLPTAMTWDAGGRYVEPIKPAYKAYWDESLEVANWYFGGMETEFPRQRALELAIRALSINYRFGRDEQAALQVIDTDCYLLILVASVDGPNATVQKKMNEPSITPGLLAGTPDIAPAVATCG